ncbi:MAG: hypothetical protein K2M17_01930 [Bacilli bacterium]|nr:hypothetical protein [Bacilli bacterium]
MKETIKYYYNIEVEDIEELNGKYHFKFNQRDYFFVFYNRLPEELEDIILCSRNLKEKNVDCHDILLNRNNQVLTKVGDYDYILMSVSNLGEEYNIMDIAQLNKKLILSDISGKLYRNNWSKLWSDKVDYFEYQIRELGLKKTAVSDSFSYYLGLAENAIAYVTNTNKMLQRTTMDHVVLSHRRIFYPNLKLNYLNPLSFVFDLEVRDIAEYLKSLFFSEDNSEVMLELESYLKTTHLSSYGYQMLYARLLYPSYYFDVYDEIMNKDTNEEELVKIVAKADDFEEFLKEAYLSISKYAPIEKIDWIME